ncbi:MAG: hypothetical protein ACRDLT_09560 [Solirubrobacteraceae bacterium]
MLPRVNNWHKRQPLAHLPSPLDHGLAFTIRIAYPDDEVALRRLASFDSQPPLSGRVLIAEVSDELWAAANVDGDRRVIADPFHSTAALVSVLEQHAVAGVPAPRAHIPVRGAGRPAAAVTA